MFLFLVTTFFSSKVLLISLIRIDVKRIIFYRRFKLSFRSKRVKIVKREKAISNKR